MNLASFAQQPASPRPDEFAPLTNSPFFPGGQPALKTYFSQPSLYSHLASQAGIEGTVWVKFRVQATGHLTHVQVVKPNRPFLDQAAIRAITLMPLWYPAHQEGVAVASSVVLPITFRLD